MADALSSQQALQVSESSLTGLAGPTGSSTGLKGTCCGSANRLVGAPNIRPSTARFPSMGMPSNAEGAGGTYGRGTVGIFGGLLGGGLYIDPTEAMGGASSLLSRLDSVRLSTLTPYLCPGALYDFVTDENEVETNGPSLDGS